MHTPLLYMHTSLPCTPGDEVPASEWYCKQGACPQARSGGVAGSNGAGGGYSSVATVAHCVLAALALLCTVAATFAA